jgi:putative sigma-54 modulation protein
MKITYTGIKQELSPKLQRKLDGKFGKLSKLLEKRGEIEAHVVVTTVRHLHKCEITVPYYEHQLIGLASDADVFTALCEALDKLEAQAVKNRGKWREKHRRAQPVSKAQPAGKAEPAGKEASDRKSDRKGGREKSKSDSGPVNVFRVNHHDERKPMTVDEAMLEMDPKQDYVVYRDAEKESVSVLVRRRDGHFDLIES